MADRLRSWRPLGVRHLKAGSGFRLADDHRAVRLRLRASRRRLVPRSPVERAEPARARLRIRTGDEIPPRARPASDNCRALIWLAGAFAYANANAYEANARTSASLAAVNAMPAFPVG